MGYFYRQIFRGIKCTHLYICKSPSPPGRMKEKDKKKYRVSICDGNVGDIVNLRPRDVRFNLGMTR